MTACHTPAVHVFASNFQRVEQQLRDEEEEQKKRRKADRASEFMEWCQKEVRSAREHATLPP